MQRTDLSLRHCALVAVMLVAAISAPEARRAATIGNGRISIVFGDRGITAITDISIGRVFKLKEDGFRLVIDGKTFDSATLARPRQSTAQGRVVYDWNAQGYDISVTYEIEPAWRFVSKQIAIVKAPAASYRVSEVHVFRDELLESIASRYVPTSMRNTLGTGHYGLFLRFAVVPARMQGEWVMASADPLPPGMDAAEIAAFTDLVRAFLLYHPARPLNIMVGWCVNDYQIDVAGADGRAEYKRIIDRAAELGAVPALRPVEHVAVAA